MRPPRPSQVFQPLALHRGQRTDPRLSSRRRTVLASLALLATLAIVGSLSIYLANPERFRRPQWRAPRQETGQTTKAIQRGPGVVDVEIQRGKETQTYRFRQGGKSWSIQKVTPELEQRGWFRKRPAPPPSPTPPPALPPEAPDHSAGS